MSVERYETIEPLADEWDDLADRAGASPFLRPGWLEAWWRAFGSEALEIRCLRREGRLAAVAPLASNAASVRSPTNWHTPEFGLLAEDEGARRELAGALHDGERDVSLAFLEGGSADLACCLSAARGRGYRTLVRTLERSPYVPIDGDWAAFEGRLQQHLLTEMRRRRRRLEEQGQLEVDVEDGRERLVELLEEGFRVEGSGWKAEGGTAIASRPETRRFYEDVARWTAGRGWLRLAFLRLDGRALAFQYLVESAGVVYQLKGGFDPAYRKFAPGTLLVREVLEGAFASGARSYEFLGDAEPFKLEWTGELRDRMLVQTFRRTPAGLARWTLQTYGRPLAKRALALARR